MDPSSGPPRSPLQPIVAEDPPITSNSRDEDAVAADADADVDARAEGETVAREDTQQAQHLARFEFSDHGTKILMVEWYPGAVPTEKLSHPGPESDPEADPGKTIAPVSNTAPSANGKSQPSESTTTHDAEASKPPPASTPANAAPLDPAVGAASIAWEVSWPGKTTVLPVSETDDEGSRRRVYFLLPPGAPIPATITVTAPHRTPLTLKALPAIFPEGFAPESGRRGVLHTIWAKNRLSELEREINDELKTNAESVGLEMAMAEKQWLVDNFLSRAPEPPSARTKSPVGGRLGDKLKGLKLATSPSDLLPSSSANTFTQIGSQTQTLSPQGADVAVPSYSAMSRGPLNTGPISLNAALHDPIAASAPVRLDAQDTEDDLFALPLSPRSPEMKRSPFSAL